jgi:hypothetical protein
MKIRTILSVSCTMISSEKNTRYMVIGNPVGVVSCFYLITRGSDVVATSGYNRKRRCRFDSPISAIPAPRLFRFPPFSQMFAYNRKRRCRFDSAIPALRLSRFPRFSQMSQMFVLNGNAVPYYSPRLATTSPTSGILFFNTQPQRGCLFYWYHIAHEKSCHSAYKLCNN